VKSIRGFLVAALLATMTLTIFLAALHGYRSSMLEVQALLDAELTEHARLLSVSVGSQTHHETVAGLNGQRALQVFRDGTLLWRSDNAPNTAIANRAGFQDINFGNHRWRSYTWAGKDGRVLATAAERIDVRNTLAENIIIESVLPVVVALPLAGLLIWFIVGYGLSPLRQLAKQLHRRRADDLAPIPTGQQPVELMQLVNSTNGLLQRLEASFERERRFASDAAHELRTPIAALKVHLHNITCTLPDGNPELASLVAAVDRMGQLVEQMLALYRTSPDHYFAQLAELDLHQLARESIASMYPAFARCDIQLELTGGTACIPGDRPALETLIKNLLDNACKYTPPGGRVRVTVSNQPQGVTLRTEDSGAGVPEDQYQRIFDRFYRLGGHRHESGIIGCGLGLAIVQHIADLHGASIAVGKSSFESGLAVTITFPHNLKRRSDLARRSNA